MIAHGGEDFNQPVLASPSCNLSAQLAVEDLVMYYPPKWRVVPGARIPNVIARRSPKAGEEGVVEEARLE